jgi:hypothetical protein
MNTHSLKTRHRQFSLAVVSLAAVLGFSPQQSHADDLNWMIAPYLWASDIGMDVAINGDPALGVDVAFSDLVDKLDMAFMGHIEVNSDDFGAFFDGIYISLADDQVINLGPGGPILGDLEIDMDLKLNIYELGGFYRMGSADVGSSAFDIIGGVRFIDLTLNLDILLPGPGAMPLSPSVEVSETDIFFGARLSGKFTEKWHYKLRADIGGGGTEGTINGIAAVGYTFGQSGLFSLDLGYRYMNIELKNEDADGTTESEITMSGPILGFIFNF